MASPVGTLRVDLSANTAQFAAGMDAARTKIAQFQQAGAKASAGAKTLGTEFSRMGQAAAGNRFAIQNAAYQVGDFAVQVAGGTSAVRAMAQQLPQLLGGFGVFGAVAGAAFAILGPLVGKLFEGSEGGKALNEAISDLAKANDAYQESVTRTLQPLGDLRKEFGDQAEQVRAVLAAQLALDQLDYLRGLRTATETVSEALAGIPAQLELIEQLQGNLNNALIDPETKLQTEEAIGVLLDGLGIGIEQAQAVRDALDAWGDADGPREVADAAVGLRDALFAVVETGGDLPPQLEEALRALVKIELEARETAAKMELAGLAADDIATTDMAGNIAAAADEAVRLAQNMDLARSAQAQFDRDNKVYSGRGGDPRDFDGSRFVYDGPELDKNNNIKTSRRGRGGQSEAQKERNRLLNEAKRLYDDTRTATEKYAIAEAELNEMLRQGMIDQETFNRGLEDAREKLTELDAEAAVTRDQFKDFFSSIIDGSKSAAEALSDLLSSFASQLFSTGFDALWGELFPNAKGNAFAGGEVIPFAKGGIVSAPTMFGMKGGLGLMGEAGPEAILPLSRGRDGKLGVVAAGGGGGLVVHIDARGAVEGTAAQIDKVIRQRMPEIVRQSVAGVGSAKRRGVPL